METEEEKEQRLQIERERRRCRRLGESAREREEHLESE